jgi:hypothetical protein
MIERTASCHRHSHPEFRISFDPSIVIEPDVQWLLHVLDDAVSRGERFADGETFQVGWMFTTIRQNEEGTLSILEPDFSPQIPIAWIDSVTHTLRHLRAQRDVCESVLPSDLMNFPSLRQSAIVCSRLRDAETFMMSREEPTLETDSGWFCGCKGEHDHQDPDELTRVSLYEAAVCYQQRIIPYLALPAGTLLSAGNGAPTIYLGQRRLKFDPGSYLATKYGSN